jgi:hypothetical protein
MALPFGHGDAEATHDHKPGSSASAWRAVSYIFNPDYG